MEQIDLTNSATWAKIEDETKEAVKYHNQLKAKADMFEELVEALATCYTILRNAYGRPNKGLEEILTKAQALQGEV